MIRNTFCHIPGIGLQTERQMWAGGILSWDDLDGDNLLSLSRARQSLLKEHVETSSEALAKRNAAHFGEGLPSSQAWRLFSEFENDIAYLDIETTGLRGERDQITTIALYDGIRTYEFVAGENLDEFAERIFDYRVLATYNGKTFDVPFIQKHMGLTLPHAHIDLRYVLAGLGYKGGLKECEKALGLEREGLEGVDGFFAVLLWYDYRDNGNDKALETLLAYNVADVVNLATLLPMAYNMKLGKTPFLETHRKGVPEVPEIPYTPDADTVARIRREYYGV